MPTPDPRVEGAIEELRALIAERYPGARFDVFERDDPEGVRLQATVDIEDTEEVMDVVIDALYDIQVERGLPVYVVTEQPLARVAEQLRARAQRTRPIAPAVTDTLHRYCFCGSLPHEGHFRVRRAVSGIGRLEGADHRALLDLLALGYGEVAHDAGDRRGRAPAPSSSPRAPRSGRRPRRCRLR